MTNSSKPILFFVILLTLSIVISLYHFGWGYSDSLRYIKMVEYFRGNAEFKELVTPFAYRPLVPFIVSILPVDDIRQGFGIVNTTALFLSSLIMFLFLRSLAFSTMESYFGSVLTVVSFPAFYHGPSAGTDAVGFLVIILAVHLLHQGRFPLFFIVVSLGVLVRETNLALLLLLGLHLSQRQFAGRRKKLVIPALLPLLAYFLIRTAFCELGQFFWVPSFKTFFSNLSRPRAYLSTLFTIGPALILIPLAVKYRSEWLANWATRNDLRFLRNLCLSFAPIPIYAVVAVSYMDGRSVWVLYPIFIPLSLLGLRYWSLSKNKKLFELLSR